MNIETNFRLVKVSDGQCFTIKCQRKEGERTPKTFINVQSRKNSFIIDL